MQHESLQPNLKLMEFFSRLEKGTTDGEKAGTRKSLDKITHIHPISSVSFQSLPLPLGTRPVKPSEETRRTTSSGLLRLPQELLLDIAELLTHPRDVCNLMRVNRQLHLRLRDVPLRKNIKDDDSSLLTWAVGRNRVELVLRLIRLKANPNTTRQWRACWDNKTPLHRAVEEENLRLVKILTKERVGWRVTVHSGTLALALERRNEWIARVLLGCVRELNIVVTTNGKTLLYMACEKKLLKIAKYLLEHGADPNWNGRSGYVRDLLLIKDPLERRVGPDTLEILRMLFLHQLEVDEDLQKIGDEHPDARVRYLFGLKTSHSIRDTADKLEDGTLLEEIKLRKIDLQSYALFPPLEKVHLSTGSRDANGTGAWTAEYTRNLKSSLSLSQKEESRVGESSPTDDIATDLEPFPELSNRQVKQNSHAQQRWSDFHKMKQPRHQDVKASKSSRVTASESSMDTPTVDADPFPPLITKAAGLNVQGQQRWTHIHSVSQGTRNSAKISRPKALETAPLKRLPPKPAGFPPLSSPPTHAKNASSDVYRDFRRRDAVPAYNGSQAAIPVIAPSAPGTVKAQSERRRGKSQWNKLDL
ncbi:hypothetical protein K458DRAFT_415184 [Lentithecium fluviatile CBS 122367]|uniref:F-box domain-containing protein n=1 Tax=Lentithecium fluviatile CBS 122367 TaxID=1168545 RepID=A0A6G1JC66_9PLEO|nr:hypothetical protein K458DRAFT_415184 [Lentithecium fluviatile CBS 122367]